MINHAFCANRLENVLYLSQSFDTYLLTLVRTRLVYIDFPVTGGGKIARYKRYD